MFNHQWDNITHFTQSEFACNCGCDGENMDYKFIQKIDEAREIADTKHTGRVKEWLEENNISFMDSNL